MKSGANIATAINFHGGHMGAAETKIVADFLIAEIEREMETTVRILEAVPADRMDYRPDSLSKSGLGLVRHITLEDEWLLKSIADGAFALPPNDSDACGVMSPKDAIAQYKQRIPAALERVRAMSGEQLTQVIDMLGVIQMPGIAFLSLMMKHSVHHRGQLSAYLRAMGSKVPGIYGPSADTQQQIASASAAD
jgi:uncharacterized damage-inducible protein DinB